MKQISIVGFIILLLLAVVFFMRDRGARAELQKAETHVASLSNEVARINTVMMMHSATNSTLQQHITNYLGRLAGLSNRLAQTSENLKLAQQEHAGTRTDLERQTKKATDGERRAGELETELRTLRSMVEGRNLEITRLTSRLSETEAERAVFHARLQKAEADVVRLELDRTDEAALRAQLKRLKRQWLPVGFANTPHVADKGAQGLTAKVDTQAKGYYLQMQPDGTIKILPPLEAAGATQK